MDITRDDLVGFALGALDVEETGRISRAVAADPELAQEVKEIERHLRLHDEAPALTPRPALWESVRDRLDEAPTASPSLLRRFWMPLAAAALVALAFFLPRGEAPALRPVHGELSRAADGSYAAAEVVRVVLVPGGITVTVDAGTTFDLESPERLALRAGRLFLEVPPEGRGFSVVAGELVAVTTGTAFLVERAEHTYVWTESGHVRCVSRGRERVVGPGEVFVVSGEPPNPAAGSPRAWFRRPSLEARVVDAWTVRIVIGNGMPDPVTVAPPTGGEALFFATYAGHDVPLAPDDFAPSMLAPGATRSFDLRLPRPLPDGEALVVSYPAGAVRAEATR